MSVDNNNYELKKVVTALQKCTKKTGKEMSGISRHHF